MYNNRFYYAVAIGRSTGVFTSSFEFQKQVKGFRGACGKKFETRNEAQRFIEDRQRAYATWSRRSRSCINHVHPKFHIHTSRTQERHMLLGKRHNTDYLPHEEAGRMPRIKKPRFDKSTNFNRNFPDLVPIGYVLIRDKTFLLNKDGYVIVYTDGSCFYNGKLSAHAGFGVYFDNNHSF